ncbi:MAG: hypothetical protein ACTSP3_05070 [Candidatus Heimdallarchaeaceae archaeon]
MKSFRKRELLLFYGSAYLVIALLNALLFTTIIGNWTPHEFFLNFSIWGLIWLVSMFAYPMFFMDAKQENLALNGYLALLGYVTIVFVYIITYFIHKRQLEIRTEKKLSITKILDLYFPK